MLTTKLAERFQFPVRLYSDYAQMTSNCSKNKEVEEGTDVVTKF